MLIIYLLLIILILNLLLLYLYYSKVWPATPSCISLIRKIVRNRLGLIWATSWYMQWDMLCKVITANSSTNSSSSYVEK